MLLSVKNLRTQFKTRQGVVKAVDGVDIELDRGEMVGLVGESGCGKSMTGLSILRLVPPPGQIVEGSILLEGEDLMQKSEVEMRHIRGSRIAMIFQDPLAALNPSYTIAWQIKEAYQLHRPDMSQEARHQEMLKILSQVGIADPERRAREYPHQFSGGMRQRVLFAIALACRPEVLLADEPTTALDVTIRAEVLDLMQQVAKDFHLATILISHDLNLIAERCDRVMVMYAGRVVEVATPLALYRRGKHPYAQGLIKSTPQITLQQTRLEPIPGEVPNLVNLPAGCAFQPRCYMRAEICGREMPELRLVGKQHWARCHLAQPDYEEDANA